MKIENIIFKNLIHNEDYMRKVFPFLKDDYFTDKADKLIFKEITGYINQYNKNPSIDALKIMLGDKPINEMDHKMIQETIEIVSNNTDTNDMEWLIDRTEQFCQEKAVYNAVLNSINILDGKDKTHDKGTIPKILSDALAVTFDNSIGHDYLENAEERFEYYHRKEKRLPFDIDILNKITKGGLPPKTLNIILAGTGVGKSLFMCHVAASCLNQGKNVLYITLEMAEEKISQRIDANLLNVTLDDLMNLPKDTFSKKINALRQRTVGKLIVKEYPTASASSIHFRTLLNELNLKKNFIPDIIFVDYLNICASSRIKPGASVNSYTYVKAIAEELRGLAVEFNVPLMSATQTTRSGFTNSDPGLEDTSESFGLPATADFMGALISSEELEEMNQIMFKQLKNRYSDINYYKRFVIGVDRSKMKLYDLEDSAQDDIIDTQTGSINKVKDPKNKFDNIEV